MQKILIIGATGSLAQYVIEALRSLENMQLTLFSRSANRLSKKVSGDCEVIAGDATDYNEVKAVIAGKDIVYVNLAGDLEVMSKNIVRAMQETGVTRIIAITSIGIYETPLQPVLKPYRALADTIETSGLDYTIIRPDWFTNADEIDYHITQKPAQEIGGAVSRKSIAALIAFIAKNPETYLKENIGISKL
ncbi:MAG: NAD(P)H-binding protein [Ferruginibacter sp.]